MHNRRHNRQQVDEVKIPAIDHLRIGKLLRENRDKKWLSFSLSVPGIDPLAYIEQHADEDNLYYWEKPDSRFAIAAGGAAVTLKATGARRFDEIGSQSRRLKREHLALSSTGRTVTEPILVGGYSFSDHNIHRMWKKFGAARFLLPDWSLVQTGDSHILTLTVSLLHKNERTVREELEQGLSTFKSGCNSVRTPAGYKKQIRGSYRLSGSVNSYADWKKQVDRCRQMISDGAFKKIVIARHIEFEARDRIDVPVAMYHLRQKFPECFNFMIRAAGGPVFMGATPERLVALQNSRVITEGLAGTISRGNSAVEDLALGFSLMESRKERSEHEFVVEDIRNNLKPFTRSINHPILPVIKKLSNVQHLYTPITAEVRKTFTIHELTGSLHPTPAVGGFPKQSAVPYINEIEEMDRGWYAGPVGWFDLEGSGEFAVAIRSAWIEEKRARLFAGCGIVRDSEPRIEWEETEMKLLSVLDALKQASNE